MEASLVMLLWLVVPIILAARLRWLGFTMGLLVLWMLTGIFIEAGWISCRPGWEPLRSVRAFFNGFGLYSVGWYVIYGLKELVILGIRSGKAKRAR